VLVIFCNNDILISQITPEHKNTNHKSETGQLTAENPNLGQATNVGMSNSTAISLKTRYVTEYSLPNGTGPNGILVDRNGLVWTAGSLSHKLYSLNETSGDLRLYQIPGEEEKRGDYMVWSMIEDNDGSIWFSQFGSNPLWRFDPKTEKFERFLTSGPPFQMKVDNKTGDIWFTTLSRDSLGVVQMIESNTENDGNPYKISEFPIGNDTYPSGLTLRGNSVWVTELEKGKVAKFDVLRNIGGLIVDIKKTLEMPIQKKIQFAIPTDLLFSDNGTLWVTEHGTSTITKFEMASQLLTRFATSQNMYHVASLPFWLRASSDGQGFWFNEHEGGNVAFFDISSTTLTEFELPTHSPDNVVFMLNLVTDPHDPCKAWFSEWNVDKIGVVNLCLSVPFEIHSNLDKVVLGSGSSQEIDIEVSVNPIPVGSNYTPVTLNASSSMEPAAGFVNMSAKFTGGSTLNLTKTSKQNFKLLLEDYSAPPGNYTLGISATDGVVIKTIFLDLVVKT